MLINVFSRIQRIDHLIRIKGTGNASQLADKLGMSRTSIYEYLDLMRQRGAPIKYCAVRKSFYYEFEGSFPTDFQFKCDAECSHVKKISAFIAIVMLPAIF